MDRPSQAGQFLLYITYSRDVCPSCHAAAWSSDNHSGCDSSCDFVAYVPTLSRQEALSRGQRATYTPTHLVLRCDLVKFLLTCPLVQRLGVLGRGVVVVHPALAHDVRHLLQQQPVIAFDLSVSVLLPQGNTDGVSGSTRRPRRGRVLLPLCIRQHGLTAWHNLPTRLAPRNHPTD